MEQLHAIPAVGRPEGAGMTIGDRGIDLCLEILVERPGVIAGPHPKPTVGIGRNVAGCMPGRTGSQFILFDQQTVADACLGQMMEDCRTDGATADDHHAGM